MSAPQPSTIRERALANRQEYERKVREAEERAAAEKAAAKAELQARKTELVEAGLEGSRHALEQRRIREEQALAAGRALSDRVPVRLGNLLGPEGNVFNVMGAVRSAMRHYERRGGVLSDQHLAVVNEFTQRTYEETLDLILIFFEDLDGSIAAYRDSERETDDDPPRFGDNPIGAFFGQGNGG